MSPAAEHRSNERGAVMVLAALLCVAIIGFVALAVDMFMFSAQQEKYAKTVEQAALSGVREYFNAKALGVDEATAHQRAVYAAEKVVALNLDSFFTTKFVAKPSVSRSDLGSAGGGAGFLVSGFWDFKGAREGTCIEHDCFHPYDPAAPVDDTKPVNAQTVTLRVPNASPLKVIFGAAIGARHPTFQVTATASAIPRKTVFALDLSRSMTRDNYPSTTSTLKGAPGRFPASEYAFDMRGMNPANCTAGNRFVYAGMGMAPADAITYGNLFDTEAQASPLNTDPNMHVKGKYRCFPIPKAPGEYFAINTAKDEQAEPLGSILGGIHSGLQVLASEGVFGSEVGIVGFDDDAGVILDARTLKRTSAKYSNPEYAAMLKATNMSLSVSDRAEFFLFPRYWGSRTYSSWDPQASKWVQRTMPAMTDLKLGLDKAYEMLAEGGLDNSRNDVILFTDGLHNCPSWHTALDDQFPCKDDDRFVERALSELNEVKDNYRKAGIVLHTFLSGQTIKPHFLLRKNRTDLGCLWLDKARFDNRFRAYMVNFGGGTVGAPPYYRPNWLYLPTIQTGGTWSPLVSACSPGKDLTSAFDKQCNETPGGHGKIVISPPYTDDDGRFECDAKGRTKQQQVEDLVRSLLMQPPFVLVE